MERGQFKKQRVESGTQTGVGASPTPTASTASALTIAPTSRTKQSDAARSLLIEVILLSTAIPLVFLQASQTLLQVYNPWLGEPLLARVIFSFKPLVIVVFFVMAMFGNLLILRLLRPLRAYLATGEAQFYTGARRATLRIPWVLVGFHVGFWSLGTLVFYALYHWRPSGGVPLGWALGSQVTVGFAAAIITALALDLRMLRKKRWLRMTERSDGETDRFEQLRYFLVLIAIAGIFLVYFPYIALYYRTTAAEAVAFATQAMLGFGISIGALGVIMIALARRIEQVQLRFLESNLAALATGAYDLRTRLELLSFGPIGDITMELNHLLATLGEMIVSVKRVGVNSETTTRKLKRLIREGTARLDGFETLLEQLADQSEAERRTVTAVRSGLGSVQHAMDRTNATSQSRHVTELANGATALATALPATHAPIERGRAAVAELDHQADVSAHQLDDAEARLTQLRATADRLKAAVSVIRGLTERTQLLALTAAIEAAHAGAHGRGFELVAEEIRALADEANANLARIMHQQTAMDDTLESALLTLTSVRDAFSHMQPGIASVRAEYATVDDELSAQAERAASVEGAVTNLASAADTIERLTADQQQKRAGVEAVTDVLAQTADHSESAVAQIETELAAMRSNLRSVRKLADKNAEHWSALELTVEQFKVD